MKRAPKTHSAGDWRGALLAWFAANQRDLPWRRDRDPYRVWISEAMLQQTRVETVIPYYERFLERYPTVADLARAPLDDVLAAWSGLGYYRRARTLKDAAQVIVARHAGRFPRTRAELVALPGIGPYTAGAVASIAFDEPEPLVDGNVARVFSRVFGIDGDLASSAVQKDLWSRAADLVSRGGEAGTWNQALMELGALVCTPKDPSCDLCPLARFCTARLEGRVHELPRPKARKRAIDVEIELLLVVDRGRWLLERRPKTGRMAELWQLPTIEIARAGSAGSDEHGLLFPTRWPEARDARGRQRALVVAGGTLGSFTHTITHHRIRASVRTGKLAALNPSAPLEWVRAADVPARALTGMTRKVLRAEFLDRAETHDSHRRGRYPRPPASVKSPRGAERSSKPTRKSG